MEIKASKISNRISNVEHANGIDYSVIFSIFKAKENRANLGTCLERFRKQVNML